MFCATDIHAYEFINVKCDPEKAIQLREQYNQVSPGFYTNKKHWNSININGKIRTEQLEKWIEASYRLVIAELPKQIQNEKKIEN